MIYWPKCSSSQCSPVQPKSQLQLPMPSTVTVPVATSRDGGGRGAPPGPGAALGTGALWHLPQPLQSSSEAQPGVGGGGGGGGGGCGGAGGGRWEAPATQLAHGVPGDALVFSQQMLLPPTKRKALQDGVLVQSAQHWAGDVAGWLPPMSFPLMRTPACSVMLQWSPTLNPTAAHMYTTCHAVTNLHIVVIAFSEKVRGVEGGYYMSHWAVFPRVQGAGSLRIVIVYYYYYYYYFIFYYYFIYE